MKFSKKLCALTALVAGFMFPENISSATAPIDTALTALLGLRYSPQGAEAIKKTVQDFVANQQQIAASFEEVLKEYMGATIVKTFDIPELDMHFIKEKLSPFTLEPVFFHAQNDDPVPQMEVFQAFTAISFSMNRAAEKAFLNDGQSDLDASQGKDFNRVQMQALIDHECCHIKNGDGDLKAFYMMLNQNKKCFSEQKIYQIMGVLFGQDFLNCKKSLTDAITREAQEMGIFDLGMVEGFDMDCAAFQRYHEIRADKAVLDSPDKGKIEAYKKFWQSKDDSVSAKNKDVEEKAGVQFFLKQGLPIPSESVEFNWPTNKERIEACDKALAKLKELETFDKALSGLQVA